MALCAHYVSEFFPMGERTEVETKVNALSEMKQVSGALQIPAFNRRRRLVVGVALLLLVTFGVAGVRAWQPYRYHGIELQPQPVQDFTLTTSTGPVMALSDFRNRFVLIFAGYTHCPDVCPLTLVYLAETMRLLGEQAPQVQVLFITVDPERDTAQQLASYLERFDPTFVGMTGTPAAIDAAVTQFGIFHSASQSGGGLVDHTNSVVVLDREGRVRLLFPPGTGAALMADDLRQLIGRSGWWDFGQ
jgi:protein SCO1/2